MTLIYTAHAPYPLHRAFVANVATKRVTRIGGVGDQAAFANDVDGALDEARFRMGGVQREKLAQSCLKAGSLKHRPDRHEVIR